jgi:signal transduction histidine kinase
MSYRSIKRVLGETSLERKILFLFGISLLVLIAGSFLWVNRITEELIRDNTRKKAKNLIETHLLKIHFRSVHHEGGLKSPNQLYQNAINELEITKDYRTEIVAFNDRYKRGLVSAGLVTDPEERRILEGLDSLVRAQQVQLDLRNSGNEAAAAPLVPQDLIVANERWLPDRFLPDNEYAYYQPVLFKTTCLYCHLAVPNEQSQMADLFDKSSAETAAPANAAADNAAANPSTAVATPLGGTTSPAAPTSPTGSEFNDEEPMELAADDIPTFFLKITLPYQESKEAINRSRAILLAVAIVTAFLAMLAMFLIARYVIVKPLKHLTDVADDVTHGQMDVRAELATGDEFEELGRSFNKMLRHLLDTQSELKVLNTNLEESVAQQAQSNLKLHEMNKVKNEFLANMSHELRTPLNSIIGFSEILEGLPSLKDKEQKFATNIRKSGRLLLELINDILDLAKLEAGRMEVNLSSFHLSSLIQELTDLIRPLAEKKSIRLVQEVAADLPELNQDATKVRQIMLNLLSNAVKFTPEGGRIRVVAEPWGDDMVALSVEDTGVGIPESDREIIFEKFRQGPAAMGGGYLTREISGTGLGLSIVREMCTLLGGRIELESEVGTGSCFRVILPVSLRLMPTIQSELKRELNEITKAQQRIDFARTKEVPAVPTDLQHPNSAVSSDEPSSIS